MTKLLIVRHGETEWNAAGRVQGHDDIPLNEQGRAQVTATAEALRETPVAAAYASDLERAAETGRILAAPHGLEVVVTPCLRERCWGTWEGRTMAEIEEIDAAMAGRWRNHEWVNPEMAEEYEALQDRVVVEVRRIAEAHDGETVLIATHGGAVKVLVAWVLGAPLGSHGAMRINNASVTTILVRSGHYVLDSYNVRIPAAGVAPGLGAR
jgi:broad specificity phosphatase PhoE